MKDKKPHAYLVVGSDARLFAEDLVLELICGCGSCVNCRKQKRGVHPDVKWLATPQEKKKIGIDQIRELKQDALYPSAEASRKVYVIEGVLEMSIEAANSLLRLLEEPPPYLTLVLLSKSLGGVLPTIVSRCQIIRLSEPKVPERIKAVEELEFLEILRGVPKWNSFEIIRAASKLSKLEREKLEGFIQEAIWWYRDILMAKMGRETFNDKRELNLSCSENGVIGLISRLEASYQELLGNANPQLLMESLLFRMRSVY
jgi:DNA polymerase-3 subunit delta'